MAEEPYDPGANSTVVGGGPPIADPAAAAPSQEPTSFFDRAWRRITEPAQPLINPAPGSNIETVRQAFGEGYGSGMGQTYPSQTRPGEQSVISPEKQQTSGPVGNFVSDTVGTFVAPAVALASGIGNSALTLGNEALRSVGAPEALIRDLNTELVRRQGEGSGVPNLIPRRGPYVNPRDVPGMTAATEPVARTPTPIEVAQAQDAARKAALRATAPPDATTDATISLLRRTNPNAAAAVPEAPVIPSPPAGWTPRPQAAPTGGLLAVPPTAQAGPTDLLGGRVGPTVERAATMTADEIRARAEGYYSTADKAAAQGAMLPQANADAVRSSVTDIMPPDPEKAQYFASTNPTVASAAKDVSQYTGKPMSYDAAMQLDRRLTADIRATRDPNEQRLLGQMQDGVRDQMDQVPDLENQRPARQAYTQYIKQSQMEDIKYGASLKNDPGQADAYVRQQATAMLKNDSKMRNWTDEERAQLEQVAKSGDIGMLGRLSVGLVKPVLRAGLGGLGFQIAGTPGALVGSEIGGDIGATQAARLRAYLSKTTLDPVMAQISRGVPPIPTPPTGPPRARMPGD